MYDGCSVVCVCLSVGLSVSLYRSVPLCTFVSVSVFFSISVCASLCTCVSVSVCISLSVCASLCLGVSVCLFLYIGLCIPVHLCVCVSSWFCLCLPVCEHNFWKDTSYRYGASSFKRLEGNLKYREQNAYDKNNTNIGFRGAIREISCFNIETRITLTLEQMNLGSYSNQYRMTICNQSR